MLWDFQIYNPKQIGHSAHFVSHKQITSSKATLKIIFNIKNQIFEKHYFIAFKIIIHNPN